MPQSTEPQLFAPAASRPFAERVAAELGLGLSPLEEREFEDSEYKIRPLLSVRGRDVYLLQSLAADRDNSADDKLCRTLFAIAALKDAGAARVTAVLPYLAYGRKDRRTKPRDPLTTRYVAQLFEAVGVDCVVGLDVHNLAAFQNAFRCRTEHLEARRVLLSWLQVELGEQPWTLVSPDAGGVKRVDRFRQACGRELGVEPPTAFMEKQRSSGVVSGTHLVGEVKDRVAIIVDDLVSSGTTLIRAAKACRKQGARAVYGVVTHGLFAKDANKVLADPALDRLVVSDSVSLWRLDPKLREQKVSEVSVIPLLAEAIRRLHDDGSLVELLESP
ncbi:ribose-phosphate pyrophosphokinase [Alkalilimnicola ehrlichii]|uniref:ribose-phosphate diphosphokinase n=1 Tax=Alkalilimnicola ehrlichii TaxID=351052 RepID=A0A3E0WFI5_9GAMM|nr:ribose-phosphate pyrophosphokinase [Alkalilimnicola ehrlichii]RFA26172.1 ribose-phosphate pyrophosphokinase [Alkalilimnicola ehrlichii]RFA31690.1 ribose-phosphate pyrophosphokinase [Alkalilimnicola ehrlichii]